MKMHPKTIEAYDLLHKGTLAFARAEQHGFRVDVDYLEAKIEEIDNQITEAIIEFKNSGFYKKWVKSQGPDININSSTQLAKYLYEVKGRKPKRFTPTGRGATDVDALLQLNIPTLTKLLNVRKLKKVRDTYLKGFLREQVDGWIHPFFNLHLVRTFRSSSDKPNYQNIPKRDKVAMQVTRDALFPRRGHQLLEIDYSGLEVCIAACYHEDPTMIKYIKDPSSDMHRDMTMEIFKIPKYNFESEEFAYLRSATKNGFVFPQFYGDYYVNNAESLACEWGKLPMGSWKKRDLGVPFVGSTIGTWLYNHGIPSYKAFEDHLRVIEADFWNNRFPGYKSWKLRWWDTYQKHGYIDMKTGFRCSGIMSRNDVTNYAVQGAAFHCLLWSFIKLDWYMRKEKWNTRLVGQIRDSIILDLDPSEREHVLKTIRRVTTKELLQAWDWITVPLNVDAEICPVDASWANKEKCQI